MPGMSGRSRMRARYLRERIQIQGIGAELNIRIQPFHGPTLISEVYCAEYLWIK